MKDIVIIAPYQDLCKLCDEIIEKNSYKNIDVICAELSQGVIEANKAVKKGAKIIISRGGTYKKIKASINIPVVEVMITSFDLLRVFKEVADRHKEKIGIVGYGNIIQGSNILGELLNLDITKIEIKREENAEKVIKSYIAKGINVFIGDTLGTKVSNKLKCKSYVVNSGEDSIINAIKDAKRALRLSHVEQERGERLRTITDFVHDGIVSIDEDQKITLVNKAAKKMFNLDRNILGEDVRKILPNTKLHTILETGHPQLGELQDIGTSKITTNRVPIIVDGDIKGVVATFNDVTELQKLERDVRLKLSKKGFTARYKFEDIIHSSEVMKDCINKAKMYSPYDTPILITGETGVGKELFVQGIHNYSHRKNGPFVAINCAALPPNLIESELFGYVEGAFTGAKQKGKPGLFELAHGGTIFLDEISEIPLELQGRLLRVLQEKEVMRVGDDKVIPIDVRVLCATNKDLKLLVEEGGFREDLFYRINILFLNIPSLNERIGDITTLTTYFVGKYSKKHNKRIEDIDENVFEHLKDYEFKGNVRELEAIIERGVILFYGQVLTLSHLNISLSKTTINRTSIEKDLSRDSIFTIQDEINLDELNIKYIDHILNKYDGAIIESAKILGIDRSTLWRKLKKKEDAK